MIVRISARDELNRAVSRGWHRVFLWTPTYMDDTGERRWLEFVDRRALARPQIHIHCYVHEYRALGRRD